ncbi:MAG: GNAT family N-acetyltransferase [Gammaproteobacteria bacterium]
MQFEIVERLNTVDPDAWDRLGDGRNPFIRHAFLSALETNHCLEEYGWYPQHILGYEDGTLVAAMPLYIKDNSYGELVFDWGWADAYHRAGLPYYPKLVCAIPYTPATGPRLLIAPDKAHTTYAKALLDHSLELAQHNNMSSLHWLFTNEEDTGLFRDEGYALRLGCQFQWQNDNYESFDHYLSFFTAQKRKQIKRERRRVQEQGIVLEIRHGDEMSEELWQIYHDFYCSTFDRKSGMATLSLDFFREIGRSMPRNVVVVFARDGNDYIATAFNMRGSDTLYGRHWGCRAEYHSLHFEACYYQGLDYCISQGLQSFEPGAQGEHKISRGFLPTPTWSAHWIAHPQFRDVITQYTQREQVSMQHYIDSLMEHSPFKATAE